MKDCQREKRETATAAFLKSLELRACLTCEPEVEFDVKTTPEQDAVARAECLAHRSPFDRDLAEGQIRVLSQTRELSYVLVAQRWDSRSWLVLPFSSYSEPATDQEMRLKSDGGLGLRVLQLWNARSVAGDLLAESWVAGTLSAEDHADAISAWRSSIGLSEFSEDQMARTGMPILRRDDPRIAYQQAAFENFARLDAADLNLALDAEECADKKVAWLELARKFLEEKGRAFSPAWNVEESCAIAAASAEKAVSADCPVEGFDGCVHVRYQPQEKLLSLHVFDGKGARSKALDGWLVLGSGAQDLGSISGGAFVVTLRDRFDGVLAIMDSAGNVHVLAEEGK